MKLYNTILLCAACLTFSVADAFGLEVSNIRPGALKSAVGDNASTVTDLKVKFVMDASDFEFICHEMPQLTSLDLSEVTIASYSGNLLLNGRYTSPANQMPEFALINSGIKTLVLPANLTSIGDGAFAATGIESVTIPSGVTAIGASAFADCKSLKNIVIPEAVTAIGAGAFSKCTALETVAVNGSVTVIHDRTFAGCTALKTISIPSTVTEIGEEAFANTALQSLALTDCKSLSSIGNWAFAGCGNLKTVALPATAPKLGEGAFYYNTSLDADVTAMQGANKELADYLYTGNEAMTMTDFDKSQVTSIGNYSLQGLSGVSEVALPQTLESLGDHAMANMSGLSVIKAEKLHSVPSLGEDVWDGVAQGDVALQVNADAETAFRLAEQWRDFDIKVVQSGIEDTSVNDPTAPEHGVTGRFVGSELIVSSLNEDIIGVQLYDMAGRQYSLPSKSPSSLLTLDASAVEDGVYIVRVLLDSNKAVALKLKK